VDAARREDERKTKSYVAEGNLWHNRERNGRMTVYGKRRIVIGNCKTSVLLINQYMHVYRCVRLYLSKITYYIKTLGQV
jgi:hypothetical protein